MPTADITTSKLLLNIVISTNGARFICIDLSNFYLITPFNNKSDFEYVCGEIMVALLVRHHAVH